MCRDVGRGCETSSCSAGGACVTVVELTTCVPDAETATPTGVDVVVVVVTELVGARGGGADTTWVARVVVQPTESPSAPKERSMEARYRGDFVRAGAGDDVNGKP